MAIVKSLSSAAAKMTVETGVTETGGIKYAVRTFSNLNLNTDDIAANKGATDENVYEGISAIGTLQAYPVSNIARVDTYSLTRQS